MVLFQKFLVVFGGFYDNARRAPKYFNDLHVFDIENYTWSKIEFPSIIPTPEARSGEGLVLHSFLFCFVLFVCLCLLLLFILEPCLLPQGSNNYLSFSRPSTHIHLTACQLVSCPEHVILFGGYSKDRVKGDIYKGTVRARAEIF
jgi:hypothetical protein